MINKIADLARFVKHIPDYYRLHTIRRRRHALINSSALKLPVKADLVIEAPNNAITLSTWERFLERPSGQKEIDLFLELRRGSTRFLDLGSAEGMISAVYARTAVKQSTIHSVEPVNKLVEICGKTRSVNMGERKLVSWVIHQCAISDVDQFETLGSARLGWLFEGATHVADVSQSIQVMKLRTFCEHNDFHPDLIKIDTESFEFEILTASFDYLSERRPKIHLELHPENLRRRNRSPEDLMAALAKIYKIVDPYPRAYLSVPVSRLGLIPK